MKLTPKKIKIVSGKRWFALLTPEKAEELDLHVNDRIHLKNGRNDVTAILELTEDPEFKDSQIGLFTSTYDKLKVKSGDKITLEIAEKPKSTLYIKKKLEGKRLDAKEIDEIVKDVVEDDLSDIEITYFVSGCFVHGLSNQETADLTKAIVRNGAQLSFPGKKVVDKHCIGGVPGNRTTPLVVSIVSSTGLIFPKTSSRAITSPAGTADTMETIANVTNPAPKLKQIIKKAGAFITWGGGVDLAAADDKMIRVRHPLSLDPQGMLLASIMAKKHSVGAKFLIIDIPYGPNVKIKTVPKAKQLANRFLQIAKILGIKANVILTDGRQPIGNGIGPVLEIKDILKVLKNEEDAPQDLKEKAIYMSGILLEMTGKAKKGKGAKLAKEQLESGKAYKQFEKIIKAQGKRRVPKVGEFKVDIKAKKNGKIKAIHNKTVARTAKLAGAPKNNGAGVYIHKHLGEKVKKGEAFATIYAESKERLNHAKKYALETNLGYTI